MPKVRVLACVDPEQHAALVRLAVQASNELGSPIGVPEIYRRLLRAGLRVAEKCAACRAGACEIDHVVAAEIPVAKTPVVEIEAPVIRVEAGLPEIELVPEQQAPPGAEPPNIAPPSESGAKQAPLFTLESSGVAAATPKKRSRAKKKPAAGNTEGAGPSEHKRLVTLYHDEFVAARGKPPAYTPRDFATIARMLCDHGVEKAGAIIRAAFANAFWRDKATIAIIAADPSRFIGTEREKPGATTRTAQHEELPEGLRSCAE